jgi:hypothetical protein
MTRMRTIPSVYERYQPSTFVRHFTRDASSEPSLLQLAARLDRVETQILQLTTGQPCKCNDKQDEPSVADSVSSDTDNLDSKPPSPMAKRAKPGSDFPAVAVTQDQQRANAIYRRIEASTNKVIGSINAMNRSAHRRAP